MNKENEKRESTKESKEKESVLPRVRDVGACAREELPPMIDVHTPPSLDLLLAFAHRKCDFHDDAFTRDWYRIMNDEFFWCHPETGTPIRHWPAYFRLWRINRAFFEALRNPDRITGRANGGHRKADNWRGTRKEDIGDVLG